MRKFVVLMMMLAATKMATEAKEDEAPQAERLPEVTVFGAREGEAQPFLPDTEGTEIYAGKKTSIINVQEFPQIINNSYRQALSKTPGLLLSEETTPLLSLGYRGLEPHRAQFTQILKDGIPIHADMFGYPEAYYTPPLESVERIDFIRGGAALMFGPQPGGALNYRTHMPRRDKQFSFRTHQTFGSDNFYSTYNAVDGTMDRLGYYTYFHHRHGDGFRQANSDFEVFSGSLKLALDADKHSRWIFVFDGYSEEHGEPGGLTFTPGPNAVLYQDNRNATSRFFDRFRLERYIASLVWEKDLSEETLLTVKSWGGYYSRFSKRQRGGGFGTLPTGAAADTNTIELQEFYTSAIESRIRHDWQAWNETHTLTAGLMFYHVDSPRVDKRGATPDAEDGEIRNKSQRETNYVPVFFENRFQFGRLSVTPGLRLENIWQSVKEEINVDKTLAGTPLGDVDEYDFVALPGLGIAYEIRPAIETYINVSRSYRPKIFTQAVPTGGTAIVPADLEPGSAWQYEIGLRGNPVPYFWWDTSLFLMDFDNQIGTVGPTVQNVGRAIHRGWEAAAELDVVGLYDARKKSDVADTLGSFAIYGNVMLLDAEFVGGPLEGSTPQYAPNYIVRTGVNYRWRDRVKVSLLGTFVGDHFADDANTANRFIPAYNVWDLTMEAKIYKDFVSIFAGINNLFDHDYYARIRNDGIDPAYRRNYYGGFKLIF
jgi:Fe(3+) dicitrate transport protein